MVGSPTVDRLAPLLGKTLILVAHPDDETGGCVSLLKRMREPLVVFTTDGAPMDEAFWGRWGSRQAYSNVRRHEAVRALSLLRVNTIHFLEDYAAIRGSFSDQQLHLSLAAAIRVVLGLVDLHHPDAILVPAYEGGHPDHDACSFIGSSIGATTSLPVWEMPLYHRSRAGTLVSRRFRECNGTEVEVKLNEAELLSRRAMVSQYSSQRDLNSFIATDVECFREQPCYDYAKPPHEGMVNYEAWGWRITAADLCRSFQQCRVHSGFRMPTVDCATRGGPPFSRPDTGAGR